MTSIDLTSPEYIRNAMHLTQGWRRTANTLVDVRVRRGLRRSDVAAAIGVRTRRVRRFEDDPGSGAQTMDFILRYAHAVGASITMYVAPSIELPLPEGDRMAGKADAP